MGNHATGNIKDAVPDECKLTVVKLKLKETKKYITDNELDLGDAIKKESGRTFTVKFN